MSLPILVIRMYFSIKHYCFAETVSSQVIAILSEVNDSDVVHACDHSEAVIRLFEESVSFCEVKQSLSVVDLQEAIISEV